MKNSFTKIKNPDLWQRFYPLYKQHSPVFHWIKGHSGHIENELCDQAAVKAYKSDKLLIDIGFENENNNLNKEYY